MIHLYVENLTLCGRTITQVRELGHEHVLLNDDGKFDCPTCFNSLGLIQHRYLPPDCLELQTLVRKMGFHIVFNFYPHSKQLSCSLDILTAEGKSIGRQPFSKRTTISAETADDNKPLLLAGLSTIALISAIMDDLQAFRTTTQNIDAIAAHSAALTRTCELVNNLKKMKDASLPPSTPMT